MISNYLQQFIFHILFTATISDNSIKILQINEPVQSICEGNKCDKNYNKDFRNLIDFVHENNPDVILWFSQFKPNETMYPKFNGALKSKSVVLEVSDRDEFRCLSYSKVEIDCYYSYSLNPSKLPFLVLNTRLWLNHQLAVVANKQIDWLNRTLKHFQTKQARVIIVGYNGPGYLEDGSSHLMTYASEYNDRIVELFQLFSTTISACLFSSEKIDSFRIVRIKDGTPGIPMFIAPTQSRPPVSSSLSNVRLYHYNVKDSVIDDYIQYERDTTITASIRTKYSYRSVYNLKNVHVTELYQFAQSFLDNGTGPRDNFHKYHRYQIGNVTFSGAEFCVRDCLRCHCHCYIINLVQSGLKSCLDNCTLITAVLTSMSANLNNAYLRLGIIVLFVTVLVAIVVAVNKVYCVRLGRHRNVFMAHLPIDFSSSEADISANHIFSPDNPDLSLSNEDMYQSDTKLINGNKRPPCNQQSSEQTYDYIRM